MCLNLGWLTLVCLTLVCPTLGCGRAQVRFGGGTLRVSTDPDSVDFGTVFVGEQGAHEVTVANDGDGDLDLVIEVSGVIGGPFLPSAESLHLGPGEHVSVDIILDPAGWGESAGTLIFGAPEAPDLASVGLHGVAQEDGDADGYGSEATGGADCDDGDPLVHPGAGEVWYDGTDADCASDDDFDQDGDGVRVDADCNDTDPAVAAAVAETWNGRDDDCDGMIDDMSVAEVGGGALHGRAAGARLGDAGQMSVASDLTDDGQPDLVLLAAEGEAGTAFVAPAAAFEGGDALVTNVAVATIAGGDAYHLWMVPPLAVDLTGDAAPDLLLGGASWYGGYDGDGRVWLVPGGPGLGADGEVSERDIAAFEGDSPDEDMLCSAAAGDIDGDGVTDVVTGAPLDQYYSEDAVTDVTGNVAIFAEGRWSGTYDLGDAADQIHGSVEGDDLGWRLAIADVDADGYDDILAGAPGEATGARDGGAVYWFSGNAELDWEERANDAMTGRYVSDVAGGWLGVMPIPHPGDVDGDAQLDLLLGLPTANAVALWSGFEPGIHAFADADWTWQSDAGACGSAVSGDTDLDGDGSGDILVGCPFDDRAGALSGSVYHLTLGERGPATFATPAGVLTGEAEGDNFGAALVGGMDLDGDGAQDLLIGAPGSDFGARDAGAVYLIPGLTP